MGVHVLFARLEDTFTLEGGAKAMVYRLYYTLIKNCENISSLVQTQYLNHLNIFKWA